MDATAVKDQARPGDFFCFVADVNTILLARAAVSYAEIMRSIHPGGDAPKHAYDGGVSPSSFVEGLIADERFVEIGDEIPREEVRGHNLAMAALAEFAFESEGWHRSADGAYFSRSEDCTMTIRPVADRIAKRFGFGVEIWNGTSASSDVAVTEEMGEPVERFAGFDISEPVGEAFEFVERTKNYRL
jgi:hypothetical protein